MSLSFGLSLCFVPLLLSPMSRTLPFILVVQAVFGSEASQHDELRR
jgi:hypothetical protein